jgi:hypothetical protein
MLVDNFLIWRFLLVGNILFKNEIHQSFILYKRTENINITLNIFIQNISLPNKLAGKAVIIRKGNLKIKKLHNFFGFAAI